MGSKFVWLKRHLPAGEIVVGVVLVILSVGILPLWTAILGLMFVSVGVGGLPWTTANLMGVGKESAGGGRFWIVLPIGIVVAWLAWPTQTWNKGGVVDITMPLNAALEAPSPVPASPPVRPAPASRLADGVRLAVFPAKHKHRLRDCEGVLTFSVSAVRFRTNQPDDSFVYAIDQVELDNDGVKDGSGKSWHFAVDGRDMKDTFRRWKAGTLPVQLASR